MVWYILLKDLFGSYNIDLNKQHSYDEIAHFYHRNNNLLSLSWRELEKELSQKWTHNKFIELLELLNSLELSERKLFTRPIALEYDKEKVAYIEKNIFRSYQAKQIFNELILPKSITEKNVEYPYSDEQKRYICNLSDGPEEANEKMEILDIGFKFDFNVSLEKRRSMRKKMFDITFTLLLKDEINAVHPELVDAIFQNIDASLQKEMEDGTDKEWWSIHNVFYGFISGTNDYRIPQIVINNNSHYSFVYFIFDAMLLLDTIVRERKLVQSENFALLRK